MSFTVCVLIYGDFPHLARRCLSSLLASGMPVDIVDGVRVGLHEVGPRTLEELEILQEFPVPVHTFEPDNGNVYKYPTMRKMLRAELSYESSHVMWFDDDSYLDADSSTWWNEVDEAARQADMLGQPWHLGLNDNMWKWYQTQPWFNPYVGRPKRIRFAQGAWWCLKRSIIDELNWPIPELRHCGGDSLLGEVLRHKGYKITHFDRGVRINACNEGRHSKSARRGYSERVIGWTYDGTPYPTDHQNFSLKITQVNEPKVFRNRDSVHDNRED